ncbi:MAG: Thivi_2564 family membrane protein, partial [Acidobacteriaceae bacterium]
MPLMNVAITLVIVGVLLWLVNRFIPMQSNIKSILNGLVTIVVIVWL